MKKRLVRYFIIIGMIFSIIGLYNKFGFPNNKVAEDITAFKYSNALSIVIIGDSVAKGTGDEIGSGFSTYIPEYIKNNTTKDISVYNGGVNELKSEGLLEQLKSGELDSEIANSDMIVLSIGGNDILSLLTVKDTEKLGVLKDVQANYTYNLKEIMKTIRGKSPETTIAFTGIYNPQEEGTSLLYTMLLNAWNNSTKKIIEEYKSMVFIDTNDIFKSDLKSYISSDKLHPNSAGYQAVSERISQLIQGDGY